MSIIYSLEKVHSVVETGVQLSILWELKYVIFTT